MKSILIVILCTLSATVVYSSNDLVEESKSLAEKKINYGAYGLSTFTIAKQLIDENKIPEKMVCNEFVAYSLVQSNKVDLEKFGNKGTGLENLFSIFSGVKTQDSSKLAVGDILFLLKDSGSCDFKAPRNSTLRNGQGDHAGIVVEIQSDGIVLAESGAKQRNESCLVKISGEKKGARLLKYKTAYLDEYMWGYARP